MRNLSQPSSDWTHLVIRSRNAPKNHPITRMGAVAFRGIIAVHFVRFRITAKSGWRC
jgi:hypothetical protein